MAKIKRPHYSRGIYKFMFLYIACLAALQGLGLYFPILLQRITTLADKQVTNASGNIMPIIWQAILVLFFIILIFGVNFVCEWAGFLYADNYQANVRAKLYDKFSHLSAEQIDQIGVARIMPALMNDSNWLKLYQRRLVNVVVYFPVAIIGSFVMLFTISWVYAVVTLASLPLVLVFFLFNERKVKNSIPRSVEAYDQYFFNIREGIRGAKEIRILGKADERSLEFESNVKLNRYQGLVTDRAIAYSQGFTAILFTLITIGIIIYGATVHLDTTGVVKLNTAIQYVTMVWTGCHTIFTWFVDYIPRSQFTVKRLDKFYSLPSQPEAGGLKQIPMYNKNNFKISGITYKRASGKIELDNVTIFIPDGKFIAIAGGIGSGKSLLADMLIKMNKPTGGAITFNEIDIEQINSEYWRHDFISYCDNSPEFIPGTLRDNFKLFNPELNDLEILKVFDDIGARNIINMFDNFLDYEIKENMPLHQGIKNVINIVRSYFKPAHIYIFDQCFEHVSKTHIARLIAKMAQEKKTGIFITYNASVCKLCDLIYVISNGKITGVGTHNELIKSNKEYQELNASMLGVLVDSIEEKKTETIEKKEEAKTVPAPAAPLSQPAEVKI